MVQKQNVHQSRKVDVPNRSSWELDILSDPATVPSKVKLLPGT
jgi:hypothetical protein